MIVAYNALSVRPGVADGGATYSLNILRKLPAALPEADLVVYLDAAERRLDGVDALTLRRIPKRGGAADRIVRETFGLARRLRRDRADVLIHLEPEDRVQPGTEVPPAPGPSEG